MSVLVIILMSMKRPVITSLIDATEGVGSNANLKGDTQFYQLEVSKI